MDPTLNEWLHLLFRWTHLIAGVMWIGHLWFFNFVNAQLAKTYDADSKKKVLPELMPRALYFFRWGALWTWVTGFLLLGVVYYMGGILVADNAKLGVGATTAISVVSLFVAWVVYDLLWKSMKNEQVGAAVSFVLILAYNFGMSRLVSGRAMVIHLGAAFGTIMFTNVWMRIWPSQRKIIAGVKGTGPAADPSIPALAGLRSKHNTYMSMGLMFAMVSNHFPTVYGNDFAWAIVGGFVLASWGLTKWLYNVSASPAPAQF